jgi:hypothetical protein
MHANSIKVFLAAACLAGCVFVSACDSNKCLSCGEGDPCPDLSGEYYGNMKSLTDNCDTYDLVVGDHYLRILSQTSDENGDVALEAEEKDLRGIWGTLSGWLCNAEESSYPKSYPFLLQDTQTSEDGTSINYYMNGVFVVATEGDSSSYSYTATLTIRITDTDNNICTLLGSVDGTFN